MTHTDRSQEHVTFLGRQLKNVPSQLVMMDEIEIEEEEEDAEGSTICEVIARMQRINRERTESETRNDLNKEEENAKSRKAYLKLRKTVKTDRRLHVGTFLKHSPKRRISIGPL